MSRNLVTAAKFSVSDSGYLTCNFEEKHVIDIRNVICWKEPFKTLLCRDSKLYSQFCICIKNKWA